MQLALKKKTIFKFGLPSVVAYSQWNITVPRPVRSSRRFLQDSFFFLFSLNKTCLAVRHRTTCFPTRYTVIVFKHGTPHTEVLDTHQTNIFRTLKA